MKLFAGATQPRRRHINLRRVLLLPIVIGVSVGFALTTIGVMPIPEVRVRWRVPVVEAGLYRPVAAVPGEEIALVYVGSSTCAWSNAEELPAMVQGLKQALLARARQAGRGFSSIGIAQDALVSNGVEHLSRFGKFDEIVAGRGWANSGIQKYVYGDLPGPAGTPQVLVVERSLSYETGHVVVGGERVLARMVGLTEIAEWAAAGAPFAIPSRHDGS